MDPFYGDFFSRPGRRLLPALAILAALALTTSNAAGAPRVDYVVPNYGPTAGGSVVVVVGEGFEPGATVTFAGLNATNVSVADSRHIVCTTPDATSAQRADVEVDNPGGVAGEQTFAYNFISTVYYVSTAAGSDSNPGTDPLAPKKTIKSALLVYENATEADPPIEIRVAGSQAIHGAQYFENLVLYYNQTVTCGWTDDFTQRDTDANLTVVRGQRLNHVARSFGLGVNATVDGCMFIEGERVAITGGFYSTDDRVTISDSVFVGNRTGGVGGAFYEWFQDETPATVIRNSVFVGNRAGDAGGAFFFSTYHENLYPHPFTASPVLADNLMVGNRAGSGGAVTHAPFTEDDLDVHLRGNRIIANRSTGDGAGVKIESPPSSAVGAEVSNNLFLANTAGGFGGGLHINGAGSGVLDLSFNTFDQNTGLFSGTQVFQAPGSLMTVGMTSDIARGSNPLFLGAGVTVSYSNVEGGHAGTGNIDADPLFVDGPMGDHYLSQTATGEAGQPVDSPSVDAGDPSPGSLAAVEHWVDPQDPGQPLKDRSTRSDGVADAGTADQGFHGRTVAPSGGVAPTIARVEPNFFSFHGDEWIVVRGTEFEPEAQVLLASIAAPQVVYYSPGILVVRPPPLPRGPAVVEVRNPGPDGIPGNGDDLTATRPASFQVAADTDPPFWPMRTGVQEAEDLAECAPSIGVRWDPAEDVDSPPVTYDIYRTTDNPFTVALFLPNPGSLIVDGVTTPFYVDVNVSKQLSYWYVVQARDSSVDPRRDLNYVISTVAGTKPTEDNGDSDAPPPVGSSLIVSSADMGATLDLEWDPVYPALKYRVYRSLDPTLVVDPPNEIALVDSPTGTTYTDTTGPGGEEFLFYLVTAEDDCGNESS
jgi:hypothetical protein